MKLGMQTFSAGLFFVAFIVLGLIWVLDSNNIESGLSATQGKWMELEVRSRGPQRATARPSVAEKVAQREPELTPEAEALPLFEKGLRLVVKDQLSGDFLPEVHVAYDGLSLGMTDFVGEVNCSSRILGKTVIVNLDARYGSREFRPRVKRLPDSVRKLQVEVGARTKVNLGFKTEIRGANSERLIVYLAPADYARDKAHNRVFRSGRGSRALNSAQAHYAHLKIKRIESNSVYRIECTGDDFPSFFVDQPGRYNLTVMGNTVFADQRLECSAGKANDFLIKLDSRIPIQALIVDESGLPIPEAWVKVHARIFSQEADVLPGPDRRARQSFKDVSSYSGTHVVHSRVLKSNEKGEVAWSSKFTNEVTIVAFKRDQKRRRTFYGHFHRKLMGRRSAVPNLRVVLKEYGHFNDSMKIDSATPISDRDRWVLVRHYQDFGIDVHFPIEYAAGQIVVDHLQPGAHYELSLHRYMRFNSKTVNFVRQAGGSISVD